LNLIIVDPPVYLVFYSFSMLSEFDSRHACDEIFYVVISQENTKYKYRGWKGANWTRK